MDSLPSTRMIMVGKMDGVKMGPQGWMGRPRLRHNLSPSAPCNPYWGRLKAGGEWFQAWAAVILTAVRHWLYTQNQSGMATP